jgi:hypothetical protein
VRMDRSERAVILAPQGRDALVARKMLAEASLRSEIADDLGAAVSLIGAGAGFALFTEEALAEADLEPLAPRRRCAPRTCIRCRAG